MSRQTAEGSRQRTSRRSANRLLLTAYFALRWLPALLWMGLIFWVSSQPQLPRVAEPLWQTVLAKLAHFGEYGVLAWLLLVALRGRRGSVGTRLPRPYNRLPSAAHWLALAIALLYAASDEWHQSFVPNRHASGWDVLIDGAGALTGLALVTLWRNLTWRAAEADRRPP